MPTAHVPTTTSYPCLSAPFPSLASYDLRDSRAKKLFFSFYRNFIILQILAFPLTSQTLSLPVNLPACLHD